MDKETLIKTIEHCISTENECYNCALGGETMLKPCRVKLLENALVIIKEQENEIYKLNNTLKECENGYQGTLFMESCKMKEAQDKIKEQEFEIESLRSKTKLIITRKPKI